MPQFPVSDAQDPCNDACFRPLRWQHPIRDVEFAHSEQQGTVLPMFSRRHFLAATAAGLAAPSIATAQGFQIDPIYRPQNVRIKSDVGPGQILILLRAHFLYHVTQPGVARRYGVGVGRAGLEFTGTAEIAVKKEWPTWRPTDEMIEREPKDLCQVRRQRLRPAGRAGQSAWRARALPVPERSGHVLPDSRDDCAAVDRPVRVERLHPHAERTCRGPV